MNEQSRGNEDHHDRFNLLNEDLRGAMYRGGADRDNVITGHVLSVVVIAAFVGGMVLLGTFLNALGVSLGDVIAEVVPF